MVSTLSLLLNTINSERFFLQYWGKQFVVCRGQPGRFNDLFSWTALGEILSTHRLEFPRLRLVRTGRVIPPANYIVTKTDRRGCVYTTHDSESVLALLKEGAMLHITSIGEAWKALSTFSAALERDMDALIQVNLHAGFATSRGFDTHWDGHDVFAIQIAGRKMWRMFGVTDEAPLAVPPDQKHGAPTQATWEGVLETGDVLYIPRGYWHSAQALDDVSLHLTFAVQHPNGKDFLGWLISVMTGNAIVRKDIPTPLFRMSETGKTIWRDYLDGIRNLLSQSLSDEMLERFMVDYRARLGKTNDIDLHQPEGQSHANH